MVKLNRRALYFKDKLLKAKLKKKGKPWTKK